MNQFRKSNFACGEVLSFIMNTRESFLYFTLHHLFPLTGLFCDSSFARLLGRGLLLLCALSNVIVLDCALLSFSGGQILPGRNCVHDVGIPQPLDMELHAMCSTISHHQSSLQRSPHIFGMLPVDSRIQNSILLPSHNMKPKTPNTIMSLFAVDCGKFVDQKPCLEKLEN